MWKLFGIVLTSKLHILIILVYINAANHKKIYHEDLSCKIIWSTEPHDFLSLVFHTEWPEGGLIIINQCQILIFTSLWTTTLQPFITFLNDKQYSVTKLNRNVINSGTKTNMQIQIYVDWITFVSCIIVIRTNCCAWWSINWFRLLSWFRIKPLSCICASDSYLILHFCSHIYKDLKLIPLGH